jgi:hypothetical protein
MEWNGRLLAPSAQDDRRRLLSHVRLTGPLPAQLQVELRGQARPVPSGRKGKWEERVEVGYGRPFFPQAPAAAASPSSSMGSRGQWAPPSPLFGMRVGDCAPRGAAPRDGGITAPPDLGERLRGRKGTDALRLHLSLSLSLSNLTHVRIKRVDDDVHEPGDLGLELEAFAARVAVK